MYKYGDYYIPERMMPGIRRYVKDHIQPGGFLSAVICNNLKGAITRADKENLINLPAYVAYFREETPAPCHGSWDAMAKWLDKK